jgi:hypothetical protein
MYLLSLWQSSKFVASCVPELGPQSVSFKTAIVSPDAICKKKTSRLGFLLGSPAIVLGLAMVTDAQVMMVTGHVFSPTAISYPTQFL